MALALKTWKSVANKGASSKARDEYKFRIVQSNVNSTTHTASYKVQFYGTDTSRAGTYEHYMNAVKLKVNGTTVATLLNSKIHMGSGRSSGYTAKYSSSSPYTTSSYTLGPLKEGDKVTVALDSSINTGDTFRYTSDTISVSSSIFAPSNYTLTYTANGGTGSNVTQSVKAGSAATLKAASTFTPATTATWGITLNKDGGTGGDATFVKNAFYRWRIGSSYYKAGASYTPSANTTVKAYWSTNYKLGTPTKAQTSADGYKVTFDPKGGSCSTTSLTQKNITTYSFGGWKSDSSDTVYDGGTTVGGPAKYAYTAQWTPTTTKGSIKMPSVTKSSSSKKTVTLNYDGATGGNSTTSLSYTKTTAYAFKGWSANSSATSGSAAGSSFTPTSSGTVYAIWGSATNTYTSITLPTPTKTNYTFNGWATSSGGSVVSTGGVYTPTSDITNLYAKWTLNTFTVTFNKNGGNTPSPTSKSVTQGSTYGTLATCTRTGYTLKGWYTASSGGTKITSSTTVNLTGNQTLYAQWTPITYTIAYNANSGTVSGNPTSYTIETATFTLKNPTRTNYTFTGWTGSNGTSPETTVTIEKGSTGNKSYTANWSQKVVSYTISYNYDGGNKGTYAPTSANVDAYVQISNPTRSGYTFKGWSISGMNPTSNKKCYYGSSTTDSRNQSTTSTSLSSITATRFKNLRTSAGTVTFKATWEAVPVEDNEYSITYSLGGGTAGSPAPTSGTKGTYINIANPTRANYEFNGWNITGLDSGTHYHGNSKPMGGDTGATSVTGTSISGVKSTWFKLQATGTVTFTATWESAGGGTTTTSYTISYNLAGGQAGASAPTSANVGSYVTISNPSRSGYVFAGWNITNMNPTSTQKCYYGRYQYDMSNQSTTNTSLSGIKVTYFKNLRTTAGTVTFTATWSETDDGGSEELSGLILRPVADTALGHTCSSGTAGYSMISEETADDNTTYIAQRVTATTATTVTSTFKLGGTLPSGVFKITGATIKVRGKSDTSGTYSGTYQLSTDSTASNITLSASAYSDTINSDVCSGLIGEIYTSSTFPEISLTISTTGSVTNTGSKTGSQTTSKIRITQAYLQLEYEPILGTAKVYTSNAWHNALPYVFINNAWKMVQAHTRKNSNWKPGQG